MTINNKLTIFNKQADIAYLRRTREETCVYTPSATTVLENASAVLIMLEKRQICPNI
ncbi:hypothetical protein GPUN_2839 [Glaciecola punicea ACAM 611]|uniref:Uncharacterized protein n=1 Tax=Glaciecola punicea ACAM 611 TaxID=1121923 RepID=H5TF26_9ALTE|nr:hypothetical protein GPUN_2839 [Glaciecola punicea ACAM 611]